MATIQEIENVLVNVENQFFRRFSFNDFFLKQIKQTGIRISELNKSRWQVINSSTFILTPSKQSNIRIFDISEMNETFIKYITESNFNSRLDCYSTLKSQFLTCLYNKAFVLDKKEIIFHIYRHLYIKKMYEVFKSVEYVKQKLGHKNINSTLNYINSNITIR